MNPITDSVMRLWHRLTGVEHPDPPNKYARMLERETRHAAYRVLWDAGDNAYELADELLRHQSLHTRFHYRHFTKPKKDGSVRHLAEPDERLKEVQHRILKNYLEYADVHPAALGFRKRKSIADHVWSHAGARLIITSDIQDFFPSTTAWRVEQWWRGRFSHSEQAAKLLMTLTTYQGSLPQGAPTSPALSNAINYAMDKKLYERAQAYGAVYTRYCDDMVFSWQGRDTPPGDFRQVMASILREHGYAMHPKKGWQVFRLKDEPQITGAVLNQRGTVSIPADMERLIHELEQSDNPVDMQRLAGYLGYRQMVEQRPNAGHSNHMAQYQSNRYQSHQRRDEYAENFDYDEFDDDEDEDYDDDDYDEDEDDIPF